MRLLVACLAALVASPVRGDSFAFPAGHQATFSVTLTPEGNATGSGSADIIFRRAAANSSSGFAEFSAEIANLSLSGLNTSVIAIHIHRNSPAGGPIVLLACGSRQYAKLSPDVVALTPTKTYAVPASSCNVPSQTRYSLLPLARDAYAAGGTSSSSSSSSSASSYLGHLIDQIHASPMEYYLNVHTVAFPEGQLAGLLVRKGSFIIDRR